LFERMSHSFNSAVFLFFPQAELYRPNSSPASRAKTPIHSVRNPSSSHSSPKRSSKAPSPSDERFGGGWGVADFFCYCSGNRRNCFFFLLPFPRTKGRHELCHPPHLISFLLLQRGTSSRRRDPTWEPPRRSRETPPPLTLGRGFPSSRSAVLYKKLLFPLLPLPQRTVECSLFKQ